ncbi:hypothetical protein PQG22_09975 [Aquirufa beregesia]
MKENKEITSSEKGKETWAKPELETVSVKEITLASFINVGVDNFFFS